MVHCWQAAVLLLAFNLCAQGTRVVLTFSEYNACSVWDTVHPAQQCATLSKCYGRRIVFGTADCSFDGGDLQAAEAWARATFPSSGSSGQLVAVEWDAMLSASGVKPLRSSDATTAEDNVKSTLLLKDRINANSTIDVATQDNVKSTLLLNDGIDANMIVSSPESQLSHNTLVHVDQYNYDLGIRIKLDPKRFGCNRRDLDPTPRAHPNDPRITMPNPPLLMKERSIHLFLSFQNARA